MILRKGESERGERGREREKGYRQISIRAKKRVVGGFGVARSLSALRLHPTRAPIIPLRSPQVKSKGPSLKTHLQTCISGGAIVHPIFFR